ncbi:unnamed protein product [Ceratitis capitata]|uniref:(Mediterranean fruit fly) hypothetical protein n=1 Tax=Ceratitis capitata TaxID=7213 RepID=A0A811V487_CERCA|nr:unnamed protein product [Ceratitis capitata]
MSPTQPTLTVEHIAALNLKQSRYRLEGGSWIELGDFAFTLHKLNYKILYRREQESQTWLAHTQAHAGWLAGRSLCSNISSHLLVQQNKRSNNSFSSQWTGIIQLLKEHPLSTPHPAPHSPPLHRDTHEHEHTHGGNHFWLQRRFAPELFYATYSADTPTFCIFIRSANNQRVDIVDSTNAAAAETPNFQVHTAQRRLTSSLRAALSAWLSARSACERDRAAGGGVRS